MIQFKWVIQLSDNENKYILYLSSVKVLEISITVNST